MLFLLANIGNITALIIAIVVVMFIPGVKQIPLALVALLIYLDITIHNIVFEYQRISLTIARIAKHDSSAFDRFSIPEIQLLLTNNTLGVIMFATSIITGFIIAYLYLNSLLWLVAFLAIKYILGDFVPSYKPYGWLFGRMDQEFRIVDLKAPVELVYKSKLRSYFNKMPHSKEYEDWAFKKYGTDLIKVK